MRGEGPERHIMEPSNRLVGLGGARPSAANEHCTTGVCSSVPRLPSLRREPAANATPQRFPRSSLHPPRSRPGGHDGLPLLRRWLQQPEQL